MIKAQSSVEYIEQRIKEMIEHGSDFGDDLPALLSHVNHAKTIHEQEIIDAWVNSAQYGMKQDDIDIMDSDEPQLAQIYYNNKYRK